MPAMIDSNSVSSVRKVPQLTVDVPVGKVQQELPDGADVNIQEPDSVRGVFRANDSFSLSDVPIEVKYKLLPIADLWKKLYALTVRTPIPCHAFQTLHHTYADILCPIVTSISKGRQLIHANRVGKDLCDRDLVASQAPAPCDYNLFWQIIYDKNYTIIDLTRPGDNIQPYYPRIVNQPLMYGNLEIKLIAVDEFTRTYVIRDTLNESKQATKIINRYHFDQWEDFRAVDISTLAGLIDLLCGKFKDNPIWAHCRAGVGRTGTLFAGYILKSLIEKEYLTIENLDDELLNLILELRKDRGPLFVQQQAQLNLLRRYAISLLTTKTGEMKAQD